MKGKKAVAALMGLTGAADDQVPLDDAPQPVESDANADNDANGNDDAVERCALEEWLRLAAKHHFDAADEALRRRYFPAVRAVVAGQARGLDSPYVQAVMELMHHLHSQSARAPQGRAAAGRGWHGGRLQRDRLGQAHADPAGAQYDEREPLKPKA